MPGEQKPHCAALRSAKADCNSASAPLSDIPSIVSIRLPSACTANIKQPRVILPSTNTEHAPQTPCSHPRWVPVSSSSSRRKSARCWRGLTSRRSCLPLITVSISSSYCIRRLPRKTRPDQSTNFEPFQKTADVSILTIAAEGKERAESCRKENAPWRNKVWRPKRRSRRRCAVHGFGKFSTGHFSAAHALSLEFLACEIITLVTSKADTAHNLRRRSEVR